MEPLKRKRTLFRREFTIAADALDRALQNDEEPTETYSTFSDCADLLFSCESALRDQWCEAEDFDEVEYQADQDKALKYRVRYSHLKNKVSTAKRNNEPDSHSSKSTIKSQLFEHKLSLPKLELPKFDGEVRKWLLFWGQFKKIDLDSSIDNTDKFQYLLQSMVQNSSARQLVESYPPSGENYTKALDALKSRFVK